MKLKRSGARKKTYCIRRTGPKMQYYLKNDSKNSLYGFINARLRLVPLEPSGLPHLVLYPEEDGLEADPEIPR